MTLLRTEHEFTLPVGYLNSDGALQRNGTMRLATAADEIQPLRDPRVVQNYAYLIIILLSRVITRLDGVDLITPQVIENLFAADLAYLQDLYNEVNRVEGGNQSVMCPNCRQSFELETERVGVRGYPVGQLTDEVAFLSYYLNWSYDDVLSMEHRDRRDWVRQVSAINTRINESAGGK